MILTEENTQEVKLIVLKNGRACGFVVNLDLDRKLMQRYPEDTLYRAFTEPDFVAPILGEPEPYDEILVEGPVPENCVQLCAGMRVVEPGWRP